MADKTTPLKKIRQLRGITQEELAAKVGTSQTSISEIENFDGSDGGRRCMPDMAEAIVRAIGAAYISELQIIYPERYAQK